MGSTRPTDKSIGEATFLPQWMKGKSDTRFDFTSDNAFSPPADDTFFLIRYPKPATTTTTNDINKEGFRSISDFLAGKRDNNQNNEQLANQSSSTSFQQPLSSYGAEKINEPKYISANQPSKYNKTSGSNDFNNDKTTEATSRSIVTVASQIMFGKPTINAINNNSSTEAACQQQQNNEQQKEQMKKVSSKSLPATPLSSPSVTPDSSPKSRRRGYGNRFFTAAFVSDGERQKNGWLLGSILGQSRELVANKIDEEDELTVTEPIPTRALSRKKSISSQNLTYIGDAADNNKSYILQAQPSELREMNFWSPTSM